MRLHLLLVVLLGAAMAVQGAAITRTAVFNEMMGSWRQAPASFEDPKLGSVRNVNSSEVTGLDRIGATVAFITLKACTAQAPNWHPNADEFLYIVKGGLLHTCRPEHFQAAANLQSAPLWAEQLCTVVSGRCGPPTCMPPLDVQRNTSLAPSTGDGMLRNVIWNGSLSTSTLKEGDVHVTPQGLLHSAINPTCQDVEYLAIFNTAKVVTEKAVPALLQLPQAEEYMDLGGFGAFMDAKPSPPTGAIYALGGNCSQLCAEGATAPPETDGDRYDRFSASLSGAPVAAENDHGSHQVLSAAQLPALADMQKGASFSYTTIKSCSFPNPHYMPHANKVTMPVSGAVNVSVLVNGTQLLTHELGTTGDFFVLPKSDLFSLSNELCRDAHIVAYWDSADAAKTYPLTELALLPEDQLAGAFGVEGSPGLEPAEPGAFWPFAEPACSERCSRGE